ncbi:MAG: Ig-like domain-containing protein, partial [Sphaerochaetaceae bacterium]
MNRSLNICNYKTLAALLLLLLPLMSVPLFAQHYAIDNVSMQPNPFSPNGDGIRDELTISFYLNNSGPVNISVEQVTPMSVLYSTTIDGHSGLNHFTWDGKDGLGTVLPDGKYALRIEFYTASYYLDDGIIINTTPPEIEMISSSPNPFSPNGDGYQDVHTVKYRVKNSNVQYLGLIKVDFAAKTAKFVDDINGNTGPFDIPYSDGMYLMINRPLAYFGNITAPSTVNYTLTIGGSYSFPVSISRGQDLYKIGQNYMPYRIVSPSIGLDVPDEFNIGEDYLALYGIEGNATFNIHNNDGSDRSLNDLYPIYFGSFNDNFADPTNIDISNGNIYSIAIGSQAGTIPGDELDDGRYIYRIKVTNAVEYATEENGELLVNSHPITVESYIAPNRISPENQDGLFDQAIIHYEPSEDGYITIKIHDQDNNLIRTLVNEQLTFDEQGGYVLWDGKDDGGNFVSSGATNIYIVEITVRDRYIPSDVASLRQSIVVDNALPTSPVLHQLFPDQLSGKEVIISGITNETNCDVILFLNGVNRGVAGKTGASPGYFEFNVTLEEGDNSIYIKLKDEVANLGTPSNAITLFLDSQPPQITILTPQENATFNTKDIDVTAKVADNGSGVDLVRFGFTIDEEESIKWINGTFLSDDTYGATYTVPASINEQKITMVVEATDMLENKTTTPTPRHFSYKLPTSIAPPLFVGSIPESNANIRVIPNNRVEVVIDSEVDLINDPAKSTIILYHPSGQGITHGLGGNITYHKEGSDIHTIRLSFTQPLESSGEDDGEYRLVYFAENILNQSITDEIFFKYDTIKPYVDNYRLNTTEELLVIDNQYFFNKPIDSISVDVNDLLSGVDFATNLTRVVLYDSNNEVVQGTGSVSANTVSWTLKNTLNPSVTHQTYRIYVRATDKAGNQLVVNRNFVLLKTIQPSITSTYPA